MDTNTVILNLLQPFIGLAGGPVIQQFVQFLKDQFRLPIYWTPVASILSAIIFNVLAATYLHQSLLNGFIIGIFSGFFACGWHELTQSTTKS